MKLVGHHLTESQIERLSAESSRIELPVAELIRRAIDMYLPDGSNQLACILKYKGYVAEIRTGFEWHGDKKKTVFRGKCQSPHDSGSLVFGAPSLEQAKELFEWMVNRDPEVLKAFGAKP